MGGELPMGNGKPEPKNEGTGKPEPKKEGTGKPEPKKEGMGTGKPEPKKEGGGKPGRRPRPNRDPMGGGQPMGMEPMGPMAKADPKDNGAPKEPKGDPGSGTFGQPPKKNNRPELFAEMYKDVWGQLPDRLRQEMDMYYREQFMPRYGELLRQYYSSIAEQKKRGPGDK